MDTCLLCMPGTTQTLARVTWGDMGWRGNGEQFHTTDGRKSELAFWLLWIWWCRRRAGCDTLVTSLWWLTRNAPFMCPGRVSVPRRLFTVQSLYPWQSV